MTTAEAIRTVTTKVQTAIDNGERSAMIDAHDLTEVLLAIADQLEPETVPTGTPRQAAVWVGEIQLATNRMPCGCGTGAWAYSRDGREIHCTGCGTYQQIRGPWIDCPDCGANDWRMPDAEDPAQTIVCEDCGHVSMA